MTNIYVEGSSELTGISGQTVRNHLRYKDPEGLLQINSDLIAIMKVAINWHDEMYYGNTETDGIIGTKNKAGTNYAYEYATASIARTIPPFSPAFSRKPGSSSMGLVAISFSNE